MALTAAQISYLRDAYAPRHYLVEIDTYDLSEGTTTTLYYSTHGFTTDPSDTPSNVHYEGRVKSALSISRNMYSPGKIGGRSVPSFGTVKLNNVDGHLDFLHNHSLNGRNIKVKMGNGIKYSYSDFFNIFVGTMDQIEWSSKEVVIKIRDFQHKLDKEIETDTYTGTVEITGTAQSGGTDTITLASGSSGTTNYYQYMDIELTGGTGFDQKRKIINYNGSTKVATIKNTTPWETVPDNTTTYKIYNNSNGEDRLKDKTKPLCYGQVKHIEAIEVDPSNRVFQVHNGQIEDIVAVYAGGNSVGTGGFTKDLTTGKFTITGGGGSSTDFIITADIKGSKETTYVDRLGDIVQRIIISKGGLTTTDIDTTSFTNLSTATVPIKNGEMGYYIPEGDNILNILDNLISSMGAFYSFDREGKFVIGVLTEPETTALEEFTAVEIMDIQRRSTPIPTTSQTVGAEKIWHIFSESDMAGAVLSDPATRYTLENEYVEEEYKDSTVITKHLLAEPGELIETYLLCNCMGWEEAKRRQQLYGIVRDLFKVKVKTQPFMLNLNDTVKIKIDRYGLNNGKNMRIVSLNEDTSKNEVIMELWG